jgi:hypothetical protein
MTREERARHRREQWRGGVATSGENDRLERAFWAEATTEELLTAVWEMAKLAWSVEHPDGPPLRLDRSVGGVRRREG